MLLLNLTMFKAE